VWIALLPSIPTTRLSILQTLRTGSSLDRRQSYSVAKKRCTTDRTSWKAYSYSTILKLRKDASQNNLLHNSIKLFCFRLQRISHNPHSFEFAYTGQSGTERNTNLAERGKHDVLSHQPSTRLLSVAKI